MNDEMIAFTRKWKLELKRRIAEARVTVREHTINFNTEVAR